MIGLECTRCKRTIICYGEVNPCQQCGNVHFVIRHSMLPILELVERVEVVCQPMEPPKYVLALGIKAGVNIEYVEAARDWIEAAIAFDQSYGAGIPDLAHTLTASPSETAPPTSPSPSQNSPSPSTPSPTSEEP
jgi:hypothetical protein